MAQEYKDTRNYKTIAAICFLLLLTLIGGVYFSLKQWVSKRTATASITASTTINAADDALKATDEILKAKILALEKITPDEQHYIDLTARVEAMEACFEPTT